MLSSSSYGSNLSLLGEKTPRTPPPPPVVCTTDGLLDVPVGGKGKGSPMNGFGRRFLFFYFFFELLLLLLLF